MALGDFGPQASAYAAARPDYPAGLTGELLELARVRTGEPVVELGAGTGIFTRHLADRGLAVTALEPSAAMRAQAPDLGGITWRAGSFERTSLPDGSQAFAVAAQAFHWAEPDAALAELRRVLRPGAAFCALWNDRENERSPLLTAVAALLRERVPEWDEAYRADDWSAVLRRGGHFEQVETRELRHVQRWSAGRFALLWRSHNRLAELAGPARLEELVAEIEALCARHAPDGVELPYVCRAWIARRA